MSIMSKKETRVDSTFALVRYFLNIESHELVNWFRNFRGETKES